MFFLLCRLLTAGGFFVPPTVLFSTLISMAITVISTPPAAASASAQCLITVYEPTKATDPVTYVNYKYVADVYINATLVARLKAFPDPVQYAGVFDIGPIIRSYFASNFNPSTAITGNQYQPFISAQVKFGEEYGGTLYTNLTIDSSRTYYDTYKAGPYISNAVATANSFATTRPTITEVDENSVYALVPYMANSSGTLAYTLDGATGSVSITAPSGIVHFNLSKANTGQSAQSSLTVGGQTFIVQYKCNQKNAAQTVAWLNKYGGYDTFDFRAASLQSIEIQRKQYTKEQYVLGPSGSVGYANGQVYTGGKQTFASRQMQKVKLRTDWLTDAAYQWLGELMSSPEVFWLKDGYFVPVTITQTNYEYKKGANQRLTNLEIDIEISGDYNTQYR